MKAYSLVSRKTQSMKVGTRNHNVEVFTYVCDDNGDTVTFFDHPTKPFNQLIVSGATTVTPQEAGKVITAFTKSLMDASLRGLDTDAALASLSF